MNWLNNPFTRPQGGQQPGGQQEPSQRNPVQQASQQQQSGQPQNPQFNNPAGAPNVSQGQGSQGAQGQQSPLDALHATIWGAPQQNQQQQGQGQQQQMPQGQQQQQQPSYDGYTVPWDGNQVNTALQRVNFLNGVNPEIMQKLQSGDMSVLPDVLNHVGRQAYTMSAQTAHGFVDRGVKTGLDRFGGSLDDRFKDYEVRRQTPDDDLIAHPANAPIFEMLKSQVQRNNPNMSPQEIKETATSWFKEMANSMSSRNQQQTQNQSQQSSKNWAQEFGLEDQQGNPAVGLPGNQNFQGGGNPGGTFDNGF